MECETDFSAWIGREETAQERIDPLRVAALAATLDCGVAPAEGDPLPPGWQWLLFNPAVRHSLLGEDGHPRRDGTAGFLPPVPLPRRMWAGGRIRYRVPLRVGALALRTSRILTVVPKQGRGGRICFVTVEHTTACDGRTCIVEEQDIVYREAAAPARPGAAPVAPPPADPVQVQERRILTPGSTLLFRYSALTFNGHRIHYDLPYAQEVEGYRGLVVHGPLTATLLQQFAQDFRPGTRLARFDFRGVAPLIAGEAVELQVCGDPADAQGLLLRAIDRHGALAMQASAGWAPA